jgi:hypothetical protein
MKKPTNNKQTTNKSSKKKEEVKLFTLVVDTQDTYQDDLDVFYIHPKRLALVSNLNDKIFDRVLIQNTEVELLGALNLNHVMKKMKVDAELDFIVCNPLQVMHQYDAKQIEANAKLAGFDKIITEDHEVLGKDSKVLRKTLRVSAIRPERNPNLLELEVEKKEVKLGDKVIESKTTLKAKN